MTVVRLQQRDWLRLLVPARRCWRFDVRGKRLVEVHHWRWFLWGMS